MSMRIREIILYGKSGEIQSVRLNLSGVSVIVGGRRRGKTALMGIVDYCLGSSKCRIRRGAIRRAVEWYAVLFQIGDGQLFVARANPAPGEKTSEEIYYEIGTNLQIPQMDQLHANSNLEGLVGLLSSLTGISANLYEPDPQEYRSPYDATIRHASFLLFQQQDEIAQSSLLFHRQGDRTKNISRTISETLPVFLGAVEPDRLQKQQELRRTRLQLLEVERKLQEREALRGRGLALARALLAEAREVGLADPAAPDTENPIALLRTLAARRDSVDHSVSEELGNTLPTLQARQEQLTSEYRRLRDELKAARAFTAQQSAYGNEVNEQAARLASVRIFKRRDDTGSHCPLCTSELSSPLPAVARLETALAQLNDQLTMVTDRRPLLESYIDDLEIRGSSLRRGITENQEAISQVVALNEQATATQLLANRQAHVLGRISLYLDNSTREAPLPLTPAVNLEELRQQIDDLTKEIHSAVTLSRIDSILRLIGKQMSQWADRLDLEYQDIRLDLRQVTVVADTKEGPIPMPEMGGGANWLGYHLVTHLALHRYFVENGRPVPRFLFLDQPSQGSFPSELLNTGAADEPANDDRRIVHDTFRFIFDVAEALKGDLQIIITDHADLDESWYQEAVIQPKWLGDEKLVPIHWAGVVVDDGQEADDEGDEADEDDKADEGEA